jgi:hypothetical protein
MGLGVLVTACGEVIPEIHLEVTMLGSALT